MSTFRTVLPLALGAAVALGFLTQIDTGPPVEPAPAVAPVAPAAPVASVNEPTPFKARRKRRRDARPRKAPKPRQGSAGPVILEPTEVRMLPQPEAWPTVENAKLTAYEQEVWNRGSYADPIDDDRELLASETSMTRTIDRRAKGWKSVLKGVPEAHRAAVEIVFTDALVVMTDIESAMMDGDMDPGDAFAQLGATHAEALAALDGVVPPDVADRIRFDLTQR